MYVLYSKYTIKDVVSVYSLDANHLPFLAMSAMNIEIGSENIKS